MKANAFLSQSAQRLTRQVAVVVFFLAGNLLRGANYPTPEPGDYVLRVTVNPPFACGDGDAARPRDAAGFCHMFTESDYTNNVGEAAITIPSDVKNASGPGLSEALSSEELTAIMTKTQHN